ncbi:MAG: alanine--glyoxylate aminotransferase family protein [Lachnospiraceae bacterium]|nr:alanine--glyoxylate aminotransferase family protein [Lachnospiraceae bacterium]
MYKMMTPGPTMVAPSVLEARSRVFGNPDTDTDFCEEYHRVCRELAELLHTKNEVYILGGEGILALEAACASLTEQGDKVLVIDNGIFGKGFADFVKLYGGEPELYTVDGHQPVEVEPLRRFLEKHHDYKYATVVHCDTPSGVLNDISVICPLLKEYGILTVVDAVASMFGEEVRVDDWQIDIVCGGSQKALSAPPGLAFVSVSEAAVTAMEKRKTPIASFYCNLLTFQNYYRDKWFPYTMPISDIYGLAEAVRLVKEDTGRLDRHQTIAAAVRKTVEKAGLRRYLKEGDASTVTVIRVPEGLTDQAVIDTMREQYGILISGSFDVLAGKVLRLGHMGYNANIEDVAQMLGALTKTLEKLGFSCKCDMEEGFQKFAKIR